VVLERAMTFDMGSALALLQRHLIVPLSLAASSAVLVAVVAVVNPIGCSKHRLPLLLDFAFHRIVIRRWIECIQVAQRLAEGLWGQVVARRDMVVPSLCSMLLIRGRRECHLPYRRHSPKVGDSVG